jgi:hypothetical protein
MISNYYIYYQARAEADVRERVRRMQLELEKTCGLRGRLLRREEDATTWMEIYEGIADAPRFEHELDEAIARHGLLALLEPDGKRHTERFIEI